MTDMKEDDDTVESVTPFFRRALELDLPIVCGNADNMCMFGEEMCVTSGAVARWYQQQGGRVHIHGKPSPDVFALAHEHMPGVPLDRILMVGDALETDIAGANAYGIDSLLLCTGIHGRDFPDVTATTVVPSPSALQTLESLCAQHKAKPTYFAYGLSASPLPGQS
jgi:ribonucleotide monophosphatase NagD (HAD superfamily)